MRHRLGQVIDAGFSRAVGHTDQRRHVRIPGRNIDNIAFLLPDHDFGGNLTAQKNTFRLSQWQRPRFLRLPAAGNPHLTGSPAGIIDQDIQRAESFNRLLDQIFDLGA